MKPTEALEKFDAWMRERRLMRRTRECYLGHASRYARFQAPGSVTSEDKVCAYLSWLAGNRSSVTQKQALNALVALYRALEKPLGTLPEWVRPSEKKRVPVWVSRVEAISIIELLPQPWNEVASLLYGSGLRISEALQLRSKDLDSHAGTVTVREGKGGKDRVTLLPQSIIPALTARYRVNRAIFDEDRRAGRPGVEVPSTVARKAPKSGAEWPWFWVFPAPGESTDPESGTVRRHHRHEDGFAKALKIACTRARMNKRVTAHSFRHGFATSYLAAGGTIQELMELMGHTNIQTTEIYLHCLPQLASRVSSPLDNVLPMFRKTA
ncbi:MAG: integron integrase [Verrucomicrobiota bacterium]